MRKTIIPNSYIRHDLGYPWIRDKDLYVSKTTSKVYGKRLFFILLTGTSLACSTHASTLSQPVPAYSFSSISETKTVPMEDSRVISEKCGGKFLPVTILEPCTSRCRAKTWKLFLGGIFSFTFTTLGYGYGVYSSYQPLPFSSSNVSTLCKYTPVFTSSIQTDFKHSTLNPQEEASHISIEVRGSSEKEEYLSTQSKGFIDSTLGLGNILSRYWYCRAFAYWHRKAFTIEDYSSGGVLVNNVRKLHTLVSYLPLYCPKPNHDVNQNMLRYLRNFSAVDTRNNLPSYILENKDKGVLDWPFASSRGLIAYANKYYISLVANETRAALQQYFYDANLVQDSVTSPCEVVVHFRCGETLNSTSDLHAFLTTSYYKYAIRTLLTRSGKTACLQVNPQGSLHYMWMVSQVSRKNGSINNLEIEEEGIFQKCLFLAEGVQKEIQKTFSSYTVKLHNKKTLQDFQLMADAPMLVCGRSTFCLHAALINLGQYVALVRHGFWHVPPEYQSLLPDHFLFVDADKKGWSINSSEVRRRGYNKNVEKFLHYLVTH